MSIYVFWEIILVSAVVGILSSYLMGLIERYTSPVKRVERKLRKEAGMND
jgi:hypothetical protein